MNKIDIGKCIGEYVGEIIGDGEVDGVSTIIRKFLHRNYAFGLMGTVSLDSHSLGNETRYLNHSARRPNCNARLVMVNGDVKIGIYTTSTIKKHGELLLDYGENYWKDQAESDDGEID